MYFELFIMNETAPQKWLNFNALLKNVKKKKKKTWSLTSGADDNPTNATQEYEKHSSLHARNLIRVIKKVISYYAGSWQDAVNKGKSLSGVSQLQIIVYQFWIGPLFSFDVSYNPVYTVVSRSHQRRSGKP